MRACRFQEQIDLVTSWFRDWNECEQTIALCSLLKNSSCIQTKFLEQVLQQKLAKSPKLKYQEAQANDEEYIRSLCNEMREHVIHQLLRLLPLLQVGQDSVKEAYLQMIHDLLQHTMLTGANYEEIQQLLSYSLIHPALTAEERLSFSNRLENLESRFTPRSSHISDQTTNSDSSSGMKESSHIPANGPPLKSSIPYKTPLTATENYTHASPYTSLMPPPPFSSHGHSSTSEAYPSSHQHQHLSLHGSSIAISSHVSDGNNPGGLPHMSPTNRHVTQFDNHNRGGTLGASNWHMSLHTSLSDPINFYSAQHCKSQNQALVVSKNTHSPLRRTSSIVPQMRQPEGAVSDLLNSSQDQQLSPFLASQMLSVDHAIVSPQSSVSSTASGASDFHQEDGPQSARDSFQEEGSGMGVVPAWLKSLRLHKYCPLFKRISYEEMLEVTEEWLEQKDVTKGARHKIYSCILKLKERQDVLRKLEKEIVDEGGPVTLILQEMEVIINTPIKAFSPTQSMSNIAPQETSTSSRPHSPTTMEVVEGDLPAQFWRLMDKVYAQLLVACRPDDECFQSYLHLINKCLHHEAFSSCQKNLMLLRKQKIWQLLSQNVGNRSLRGYSSSTIPLGSMSLPGQMTPQTGRTQGSGSEYASQPSGTASFFEQRSIVGSGEAHSAVRRLGSLNTTFVNDPGLLEPSQSKQTVSRTRSAPINNRLGSLTLQDSENAIGIEINSSLHSLCISMAEHALGGSDNNDSISADLNPKDNDSDRLCLPSDD